MDLAGFFFVGAQLLDDAFSKVGVAFLHEFVAGEGGCVARCSADDGFVAGVDGLGVE